MPALQELSNGQINEAIRDAVVRLVPLTVTLHRDEQWVNLRSRAVAMDETHVFLEIPHSGDDGPAVEIAPAEKVGLSFKLRHYKHIASATVAGPGMWRLDDGTEIPVLRICSPYRMQRLQRRAFHRATVPPGRIVRASFWLGGCAAEPAGTSPESPVWSGQVTDLSAGGVQVATRESVEDVEVGDTVGIRMAFGTSDDTLFADAQFRHSFADEGRHVIGFQFAGLIHSQEGRNTLQRIAAKVSEFQRLADHHLSRRQ